VSLVWEDAWDVLNEHFRRAADSLAAGDPALNWSCGHSDNEAFPFRAWASFSRSGTEATDLVISFDVLKKEDKLLYSTDIGLEDGRVLADGPTGIITMTADLPALRARIDAAVSAAAAFIDDNRSLLAERIRRPP